MFYYVFFKYIFYPRCVYNDWKILLDLSIKSTNVLAVKSTTNQKTATILEMHYNECMN